MALQPLHMPPLQPLSSPLYRPQESPQEPPSRRFEGHLPSTHKPGFFHIGKTPLELHRAYYPSPPDDWPRLLALERREFATLSGASSSLFLYHPPLCYVPAPDVAAAVL